MSEVRYIAFIDLLATKQSLDIGHDSYYANLKLFRQGLEATSDRLDRTDRIYAFSDCAYIAFSDMNEFSSYLNFLRKYFISKRLYFRCAISIGELDGVPLTDKSGGAELFGFTFGSDAVSAYLLHERYKGVGVIVDGSIRTDVYPAVFSCYFSSERGGALNIYRDIKLSFDSYDEELELLRSFEFELRKQSVRSKRIGRYYIPMLISWIASCDYSDLDIMDEGNGITTNKPIVNLMIFNKSFDSIIQEIHGFENAYFMMYSMLFSVEDDEVSQILSKKIASKRNIRSKVGSAHTQIISEKIKNNLLERIMNS